MVIPNVCTRGPRIKVAQVLALLAKGKRPALSHHNILPGVPSAVRLATLSVYTRLVQSASTILHVPFAGTLIHVPAHEL